MSKEYVTQVNGDYRITDSRVSLDSVVYAWRDGNSPEGIMRMFPVLTLEEIYGAITFYLANQEEVDEYLRQARIEFDAKRRESHENLRRTRPELYRKLMAAKEQRASASVASEAARQ